MHIYGRVIQGSLLKNLPDIRANLPDGRTVFPLQVLQLPMTSRFPTCPKASTPSNKGVTRAYAFCRRLLHAVDRLYNTNTPPPQHLLSN